MNPRTFPGPWRVEPTASAFVIKDARGFSVAHIYWKPQPALRDQYFSQSEALVVAEGIAKLPKPLAVQAEL